MTAAAIMAVAGGIAGALGHAPFGFWYLAFPGLALIIRAVALAPTPWRAFRIGWLAGSAYFAVALHWIVEPFLVDAATHGWMAPFALILMAGGLALFWGLAGYAAGRLGETTPGKALIFAVALAAAEMLRGYVFTGFPWAMPGYIWVDTPLRGVAAYTGSFGLTALTLVVAALAVSGLRYRAGVAAAILLLAGLYVLGDRWIGAGQGAQMPGGRVAVITSNILQQEKWRPDKIEGNLRRLREATAEAAQPGDVTLVIWPEASVAYPLDMAGPELERAAAAADGAEVVLGLNRRDGADWFNSMAVVGADGTVRDTYDKVHLVPFGEYIPFKLAIFRAMAATRSNGFTPGAEVRLIETPLGRALPLICYEGVFPAQAFRAGERPDFILLITNDAWFGTFAGPQQHFDQARFRAVEQGVSVVRSANRGISGIIDPFGQVVVRSPANSWQQDAAHLIALDRRTLYSRLGDLPVAGFLLVTLIALWVVERRNAIAKRGALS